MHGHEEQAPSNSAGTYAKQTIPYGGRLGNINQTTTASTLDPAIPLMEIHSPDIAAPGMELHTDKAIHCSILCES